VKDVLQKLSWFYYLKGDMENALAYRALILKRGGTEAEADKQAQEEASRGTWPNRLLLKARLLNDGGYHHEALQLLEGRSIRDFAAPEDKLEFTYWLGRIYDDSGRKQDAITAYLTTLQAGSQSSRYFAARAALQIGYIYESQGQKSNAIVYFKKCISLKNHDYKNSLDQKAKAGISRCENE
jgi:tetratricopeptide (TPR) repeat protein